MYELQLYDKYWSIWRGFVTAMWIMVFYFKCFKLGKVFVFSFFFFLFRFVFFFSLIFVRLCFQISCSIIQTLINKIPKSTNLKLAKSNNFTLQSLLCTQSSWKGKKKENNSLEINWFTSSFFTHRLKKHQISGSKGKSNNSSYEATQMKQISERGASIRLKSVK